MNNYSKIKPIDNKSFINSTFKDIVKILVIIKKNILKLPKYLKLIQKGKTTYFFMEDASGNGNYYFYSIIGIYEYYHNSTSHVTEDYIKL